MRFDSKVKLNATKIQSHQIKYLDWLLGLVVESMESLSRLLISQNRPKEIYEEMDYQ